MPSDADLFAALSILDLIGSTETSPNAASRMSAGVRMMFSDTSQKATHRASIAARSVASCCAGSAVPEASVGIVAGSEEGAMSLAATEDRGLVDMTATVGARAADDDEVDALGLSAVLDVQPVTRIAVAARHPTMRHSEGWDLFMLRCL